MLVITKRRKVGTIGGRYVYGVDGTQLLRISNSTTLSTDESRCGCRGLPGLPCAQGVCGGLQCCACDAAEFAAHTRATGTATCSRCWT